MKKNGLPDGLDREWRNGRWHYRYRDRVTGERHRFGSDRRKAIEAAKILNARYEASEADRLVARVEGRTEVFGDFLTIFDRDILPMLRHKRTGQPYSETTLYEYRRMIGHIRNTLGELVAREITTRDVADFLAEFPIKAANRYRTLLSLIFRYAVARGWADVSPVAATIPHTEVTDRRRLDLEGYSEIHERAEPWFQRAMEGALITLQARQTLVIARFEDEHAGHLYVTRQKVTGKGYGHIRISIGDEVRAWIDRCRDDVLSPLLIHRKPKRRRREYLAQKEHWTQVSRAMLSREFARLRDEIGRYSHLEPLQRPSFHEIRSLGGKRYEDAGWTEEAIQRLYGHVPDDSSAMTRTYLDGHGVRWLDARAGLDGGSR